MEDHDGNGLAEGQHPILPPESEHVMNGSDRDGGTTTINNNIANC